MFFLIAACALAAAALAVVAVVRLTGDDPATAASSAAREAGRSLTAMAGVSLRGTYDGRRAVFTVTSAGTARGDYTSDGVPVSRIDVGSKTYLRAGPRFWTAHGESSDIARIADGRWTQSPYGYAELGLVSLSPEQLGQNLTTPGDSPAVERTSLNGMRATRLSAGGLAYFVSVSEPHRVLRVEGRTVRAAFSFDVTPLPTAALDPFFTALRRDVGELKDAYNPNVIFLEVSGSPRLSGCGASGCTVSGSIEPDAWGGSGRIHVVTTVLFTAGGTVVSTCSDSTLATSKLPMRYSCHTGGHAWTSWYRSHAGRLTVRAIPSFAATVNSAQDVSHLLLTLAQEQRQTS